MTVHGVRQPHYQPAASPEMNDENVSDESDANEAEDNDAAELEQRYVANAAAATTGRQPRAAAATPAAVAAEAVTDRVLSDISEEDSDVSENLSMNDAMRDHYASPSGSDYSTLKNSETISIASSTENSFAKSASKERKSRSESSRTTSEGIKSPVSPTLSKEETVEVVISSHPLKRDKRRNFVKEPRSENGGNRIPSKSGVVKEAQARKTVNGVEPVDRPVNGAEACRAESEVQQRHKTMTQAPGVGSDTGLIPFGVSVKNDHEYDRLLTAVKKELNRKAPRELPNEVMDSLLAKPKKEKTRNLLTDEGSPFKKWEVEEYDWETEYQIGPETFLMQLRNPGLAGRIRDYRRYLSDASESYEERAFHHLFDKDVSVRERRRYTDLLKTDKTLLMLINGLENQMAQSKKAAVVENEITERSPVMRPTQETAGHGPIFQHRLQDVYCAPYENQVLLQCKVIASPLPTLRWFHNEVPIVADEGHELSFQNNWAKLIVKSVFFSDAGMYKCFAQNEYGYSSCCCRLIMADIPERPGRPEVRLASDNEVLVVWELPMRTGGLDLLNYCLEYRRAGEGEWSCPWFTVSDCLDSEAVIIKRLEPMGIYQFRVFARNSFGVSEPSLSSRIIQTHQRGAPKLNLDILKHEYVLNVINLPQSGCLGDIPEDESEGDTEGSHSNFNSCSASIVPARITEIIDNDPSCRFQLESVIFRGRFCTIRNAVDKLREGAAHCVAKIMSDKPEFAEMSFRECDVLRQLRHRNVTEFIAAYRSGGHLTIFMERLHDGLFDRFTFDDYYTEEAIAKVMVQVVAALQWMHFQRLCYLNLLPDNVMFCAKKGWNVKLIDMGSARCLDDSASVKNVHFRHATFAAPEMLYDATASPASDMWGLGLLCFILLSGFHPFATDSTSSEEEIVQNICNQRLDIECVFQNCSQEALRFVTWALKKHPANRMNTEEALLHKWLSFNEHMKRRRESILFSANRLRAFYMRYRCAGTVDIGNMPLTGFVSR